MKNIFLKKRKNIFFQKSVGDAAKPLMTPPFPRWGLKGGEAPFALWDKIFEFCIENNIETRPIISGNLLRQTCYGKFADPENFANSDYLHNYCFYVGLHYNVKENQVLKLVKFINSISWKK